MGESSGWALLRMTPIIPLGQIELLRLLASAFDREFRVVADCGLERVNQYCLRRSLWLQLCNA